MPVTISPSGEWQQLRGLEIDCERESARSIAFIQAEMARAGFGRAVVGLSGGVDSSLVAMLSVRALGADNVLAMIMPYETSNPESEAHARLMIEATGMRHDRFDITPLVKPFLAHDPAMDARRQGNVMARCRMIVLYDQSAAFDGLVMGTSNRTETLLGYFTLHGDGAAGIKPIAHLYKCQVRALARHLGVPEEIISKAPSADLWASQTDEGELGFTYDEADQILYLLTECNLSAEEIATLGFDIIVIKAIQKRMEATAFKRQPPPSLWRRKSR